VRTILTITKALADPNRVRLLMALRGGERCVCQLIELLGLAGSTVSGHLSVLLHAGLVDSRKDERWVHYRLAAAPAESPASRATTWLDECLAGDPQIKADARRMKAILREDPSALCKRQCIR
jgi:DNA-binding transcriptional ArsR family regulator